MRTALPKIGRTAGAALCLLAISALSTATAGLKLDAWSNSKTHDRRTMFVAAGGEQITFSVHVEGAERFEWTVNKRVRAGPIAGNARSSSFSWTVPDEKGIWEIHVAAGGGGQTLHHEWVVSTLKAAEAPDLFDSFTDKRHSGRTQRDPWGCPLPEWSAWAIAADWTEWQELWRFLPGGQWGKGYGPWYEKLKVLDASCGFLQAPSIAPEPNYPRHLLTLLTAKTGIEFGTWKFRFRFPNGRTEIKGGKTHLRFYFAHVNGYYWYPFWYGVACDGFNAFRIAGSALDEGAKFPVDQRWHQVTIIRTAENELYSFVDGAFQFRGWTARRTPKEDVRLKVGLARFQPDLYPRDTVFMDGIEVYNERYLFPAGWNDRRAVVERAEPSGAPAVAPRIIVRGRQVRLDQIARAVNDPALFAYDAASGEAFCKTDLLIDRGADLVLSGQTLRFEPTERGARALTVSEKGSLQADNSHIASGRLIFTRPFDLCLKDTRLEVHEGLRLLLPPVTMGQWRFEDIAFEGDGPRAEMVIDLRDENTHLNLYSVDFGQATLTVRGEGKRPVVLGLANCRFQRARAVQGASIALKYYLDVRVLDARGRPVPGATVTVRNEVDDINYPAENWQEFQPTGGGKTAYLKESVLPRLISYTPKRQTRTGPDGHTPLPRHREDTLIVTDFVQHERSRKEFTYTIEAVASDGRQGRVTGVDPTEQWYRSDPKMPEHTVNVVLEIQK